MERANAKENSEGRAETGTYARTDEMRLASVAEGTCRAADKISDVNPHLQVTPRGSYRVLRCAHSTYEAESFPPKRDVLSITFRSTPITSSKKGHWKASDRIDG